MSPALRRPVALSLNKKLGLLCLGVVSLLGGVCWVVVRQLLDMRVDAGRLLEESVELGYTNDLDAHFESIDLLLRLQGESPRAAAQVDELLRTQVQDIHRILERMKGGPEGREDPSRAPHQAQEVGLARDIEQRLDELLGARASDGERAAIERLRQLGREMTAEASAEAARAEQDLRQRSREAVRIMLATVLATGLVLAATLVFVLLTVVQPLRELRRRAEAVGRGEDRPGPPAAARDEIGELARSFDEMASQVSAARSALEQRVASRTRELVRAARYADLGVLAAGVAHEINNPLASIASCAEGLLRRLERGTLERREQDEYLNTIRSEAYRARDITQQLLTLARSEPPASGRVELQALLQELGRVTRHPLEQRRVQLAVEAREPMVVAGNSGELLQALVNLVLNARDASPAGGTVRVRLAREEDEAVIDVDDEGPGVPPELVERIFEPFFTTKPPGEGTGLGLSLVAAVVEGHSGSIVVTRAPAGGARFRVRLPLGAARAAGERS